MTDYRDQVMTADGFDPLDLDGVHLRVWAQMKMTGELAKAISAPVTVVDPLVDYAVANLGLLRYGSATMNAARAEYLVRDALM